MNITDAIFDPELGCTGFTVERITYTRSRSGTISRIVTAQAMGTIHPGTPEMLQLLPEEVKNASFTGRSPRPGRPLLRRHDHRHDDRRLWLTLAGSIESIVITVNVQV